MTQEQKEQIRDALTRYSSRFPTQLAASQSLQGISPTIISQVKNNKWKVVNERMWQLIARQVGFYCGNEWRADKPVQGSQHHLGGYRGVRRRG